MYDLVAELKESLRVHASWLKRLNGRLVELEDERTRIIDALPVCPTCDGEPPTADLAPGYFHNCPDCPDSGRMDVFRALARLAELEAIVTELDSLHEPLRHSPSPNSYVSCSLCHETWPCAYHVVLLRAVKP